MKPATLVAVILLLVAPWVPAQGTCSWSSLGGGLSLGSATNPPPVGAMATFDDGTGPALYVGGFFTMAGGVPANGIAKWDGTSWTPLGAGVAGLSINTVAALAVWDDGTGPALYVGGSFSMAGGTPANNIAKWDGSSWSSLGTGVVGVGSANDVAAMEAFDDGTGPALYVGGTFGAAGGVAAVHIAKWDGTSWSPLSSGMSGLFASVRDLAVFDDGGGPALYAGGAFSTAGGVSTQSIARWDGSSWSSVGGGLAGGLPDSVLALTVWDAGGGPDLYAGGLFPTVGGVSANNIASWDGASWSQLGSGVGGPVQDMAVFDDGTGPALHATGNFGLAGATTASLIAKWDGSTWSALGSGLSAPQCAPFSPCPTTGYYLAVSDGATGPALYAGGVFSMAGGSGANNIAKWDCGSSISVSYSQPGGPGTPVYVNNTNLTPGNEYFNIFSLDLCPGGPGTGPIFGGCVGANLQFVLNQLTAPVGAEPFHIIAPSSYVNWGPFNVGPVTVDAICIDVTGGVIGPVSPVVRIVVQ